MRHFKLWTCDRTLTAKRGVWGGQEDRNLACVAFHGGHAFTGSAKGKLLKWKDNQAFKSKNAHPGASMQSAHTETTCSLEAKTRRWHSLTLAASTRL